MTQERKPGYRHADTPEEQEHLARISEDVFPIKKGTLCTITLRDGKSIWGVVIDGGMGDDRIGQGPARSYGWIEIKTSDGEHLFLDLLDIDFIQCQRI